MKYSTRVFYTETQKTEMWDRWQKGESLNSIGRHFGCGHSSIQHVFARTGGIRPAPRQRSRLALTLAEREEISRGVAAGDTTGPTKKGPDLQAPPFHVSTPKECEAGQQSLHCRPNRAN
jgi:hypothetical protein